MNSSSRTAGIYQFAPFQQFGPFQLGPREQRLLAPEWLNDLQRISASPENAAGIQTTMDEISIGTALGQAAVATIVSHADRERGHTH